MTTSDRAELAWDERGLLPAIVQQAHTGAVLMLAWMNAEALERTRATGLVTFYSRSRAALWQKGETSGNLLRVRDIRVDCDVDAILVTAEPAGPTCHTGRSSCFHRVLDDATGALQPADDGPDGFSAHDQERQPAAILDRLERVLRARRESDAEASYTRSLMDQGFPRILAKIEEEQRELAAELPAGLSRAVVHETADLLYHIMVALVVRDIPLDHVWRELARRFGVSGHEEKASRDTANRST